MRTRPLSTSILARVGDTIDSLLLSSHHPRQFIMASSSFKVIEDRRLTVYLICGQWFSFQLIQRFGFWRIILSGLNERDHRLIFWPQVLCTIFASPLVGSPDNVMRNAGVPFLTTLVEAQWKFPCPSSSLGAIRFASARGPPGPFGSPYLRLRLLGPKSTNCFASENLTEWPKNFLKSFQVVMQKRQMRFQSFAQDP